MEYKKMPLSENVEEMFIGPFGSSLKNECFVAHEHAYCMVYEQKHAIQKTMNIETRYVDEKKYKELQRFNVKGGDIIVSCRGTIGETFVVPEEAPLGIMHPSIMKIRLKNGVYDRYYFNSLLKMRLKKHEAEANGSGIKMAISATELGKELFPVPSLVEQERIKEILSGVEALISKGKEELQLLDNLIKARFVELFGLPVSNTKGWKTEQMNDVAPTVNYIGDFDDEVWLLNLDMVESQTGRILDYLIVSEAEVGNSTCTFDTSNVLYSKLRPYLNKVVIPDRCGYATSELVPLQPVASKISREYLAFLLRSDEFVNMINEKVAGAKMPRVSMSDFRKFDVPIPPMELQEQFTAFVKQIDKSKVVVQKALDEAQLLFDSLMQKYFG